MKNLLSIIIIPFLLFASCEKKDVTQEVQAELTSELNATQEVQAYEPEIEEKNLRIGTINDTNVRLRSEPNLESETLTLLNTGKEMVVLEQSAEKQIIGEMEDYWYKVTSPKYNEGWVYGFFLDVANDYEVVFREPAVEEAIRAILKRPTDKIYKSDVIFVENIYLTQTIKRLDDLKLFSNLISFHIQGMNIIPPGETPSSILKEISSLPNLTVLDIYDNSISDIHSLSNLINLNTLHLGLNNIVDINPLANLKELKELNIEKNFIVDINAISKLKNITKLNISGNSIHDLNALGNITTITDLQVSQNNISDISILSNLPNLSVLKITDNHIKDITPLKELNNLTDVYMGQNYIADITALAHLTKLTKLDISSNSVNDFSVLKNLTGIEELNLQNSRIDDVSVLRNLINLVKLNISYTDINTVEDLRELTNLQYLSMNKLSLTDTNSLEVVANLKKITHIELRNNNITSVDFLSSLSNLEYIDLRQNPNVDIGVLTRLENLKTLAVDENINVSFLSDSVEIITEQEGIKRLQELNNMVGLQSELEKKYEPFEKMVENAQGLPNAAEGSEIITYFFKNIGEYRFFNNDNINKRLMLDWRLSSSYTQKFLIPRKFDDVCNYFELEEPLRNNRIKVEVEYDTFIFSFSNGELKNIVWSAYIP